MPNGYNGYGNDPRDPRDARAVDPRNDSRVDPRLDPRDQRNDPRGAPPPRGAAPSQQRNDAPSEDEVDMSGTWPCRAVKHRFGEAGTQAIQIGVRVRFTGGKFQGRTCIWYSGFSDKGEDITLRGMEALGFRGGDDIFDCRGFYDPKVQAEIADAEAVVTYERNNRTGKMVNKVNFINGGDIQMAKDLSSSDEQRFRSRMRSVLARRGGARGAPSSEAPAGPPPPRDQRQAQPAQGDPWDEPGGAPPQRGARDPGARW